MVNFSQFKIHLILIIILLSFHSLL